MKSLLIVLWFVSVNGARSSEAITANSDNMNGLIKIEKMLLNELYNYIAAEKMRLRLLERFAENTDKVVEIAIQNSSKFLHDPVNIIQSINRFTNGWMKLHEQVYVDNNLDLMRNITEQMNQFPTRKDFEKAATKFLRLQDIYQLDPKTLTKGLLGSLKGLSLNSEDCFAIGKFACSKELWKHCRQWMLTALDIFNEETISTLKIVVLYEYLALSEYNLGNLKKASLYTDKVLQHDHNHDKALITKSNFKKLATEQPEKFVDKEENEHDSNERHHTSRYEELCRRADLPAHVHTEKMICYYDDNNRTPRLLFRPIKTEVVHVEPAIFMFHDFISEREIKCLREFPILTESVTPVEESMATGLISRSNNSGRNDDEYRSDCIDRINERIEDLTGLDMHTAEQLQVVNYGIGSESNLENEILRTRNEENGNRLSTMLIYLTDVDVGGATIFPFIGVRITPVKGSAVFWWDLLKSGERDYTTVNVECPLLVGSKLVCNKWIYERGQEFRRPCGLSPDEIVLNDWVHYNNYSVLVNE